MKWYFLNIFKQHKYWLKSYCKVKYKWIIVNYKSWYKINVHELTLLQINNLIDNEKQRRQIFHTEGFLRISLTCYHTRRQSCWFPLWAYGFLPKTTILRGGSSFTTENPRNTTSTRWSSSTSSMEIHTGSRYPSHNVKGMVFDFCGSSGL